MHSDGSKTILRTGLIGAHIGNSRFAAALRIMCDAAGIDLVFEAIDTAARDGFDFKAEVNALIAAGWTGVSVTHPYKMDAARFAGDHMSGAAAGLSAANTLVFDDPVRGYNTDYTGFLGAWEHLMNGEKPGRVAMAGAGGVAQAIAPALCHLGADRVTVWDIAPQRAQVLAQSLGGVVSAVSADAADQAIRDADGLVNATAVGMAYSPGTPFDRALIGGQRWAFDAVYTPTNTTFLSAAERAGLKTISGFDFFRHMAIGSFEAYTGVHPDTDTILAELSVLKPD